MSLFELKTMFKLDLELKLITSDLVRVPPGTTLTGANLSLIVRLWKVPRAIKIVLKRLFGGGSGASSYTSIRKSGAKSNQAGESMPPTLSETNLMASGTYRSRPARKGKTVGSD